jgi:hypothetical protein
LNKTAVETIVRHLKGIVAALEKSVNTKEVDINFKGKCLGCAANIQVGHGGWERGKQYEVGSSSCNTKQAVYPNHVEIDRFTEKV